MTTVPLGYQILPLDPVHIPRVAALHNPPLTLEEATAVLQRFWSYVQKADGDGCWTWIGGRIKKGYGRASIGRRKTMLANRLSYTIHVGPLSRKADLARDYGSRMSHISTIVTGALWKDAGGPIAQEVAA